MRQPLALALLVLLAQPAIAAAQSTDDPAEEATREAKPSKKSKKKAKGKEKPSRPEPLPAASPEAAEGAEGAPPPGAEEAPIPSYDENGEPAGATENPKARDWDAKEPAPVAAAPTAVTTSPTVYPIERIFRPLVLPRHMVEASLELPMTVDPASVTAIVRGAFGVTKELQVGLRYAIFTSADGETFGGKTVAIDAEYDVFPWLSAQIALPINFDPYAQGVVFGAPMKFAFWDKFSIELGRDLVGVKLAKFLPSAARPAENAALAAAEALNEIVPASEVNLGGTVFYQFAPNLAGEARYNVRMPEFEATGAPHEATLGVSYSTSNMLDIGARLGFFDLANASESFLAQLSVAYRR
jgi:hypothetical protein